jgi:hypothetical protein
MGREREFLGHGIERTHNTGRLLLDRRILDSQIQSTVERTECRVSLFQRPPFPCSYLWLTFLGFVLLTGGWTALDVCVYLDPESCRSSHSSVSLVIHHLITWALAVGVFSPSRLTLHCGLSWDSLVHCRLHFIRLSWSFIIPGNRVLYV